MACGAGMAMPVAMPIEMRTATRPPMAAETGIKRVSTATVPTPAPKSIRGLFGFVLTRDFKI